MRKRHAYTVVLQTHGVTRQVDTTTCPSELQQTRCDEDGLRSLYSLFLAFLLRRRRERTSLDLAPTSLGVALVLLIATPSKWPWHFGALVGIAAVAVASETIRLRRDAADARGWSARPFVVVGAAVLALVWAAGIREPWNPEDLRSLDWTRSTSWFQAETVAVAVVCLFAGAVLVARRRARPLSGAPWELATRAALLLTVPLIALTVGTLTLDALRTNGWTLTRQNLQTLGGDPGCGLGDELLVPTLASVRPLSPIGGGEGRVPAWLAPSPVEGVDRFSLGPSPGGPVRSPWYALATDAQIGIFISGPPGASNALSLEWGKKEHADAIASVGRNPIVVDDRLHDERALPWIFALAAEIPQAPAGADAVRVVLENPLSRGSAVGVTAPVTYSSETLTKRLSDHASATLIHPIVLPYFPCARQPTIREGVAETPGLILNRSDSPGPALMVGSVGPFAGLLDTYSLQRLALTDSGDPPVDTIALGVDKRIEGAIEALPDSTTAAS